MKVPSMMQHYQRFPLNIVPIITALPFLAVIFIPYPIRAEVDCVGTNQAYAAQGIACRCVNGKVKCDSPSSNTGSGSVKTAIVGSVVESLVNSLFSDNTAKEKEALAAQQAALQNAAILAAQAEAEKKAKDAAAKAEHDKIMQSMKQLDSSQKMDFKVPSNSVLGFKTLNGDMESLAAKARNMPGTAASPATNGLPKNGILNDPSVVDLRGKEGIIDPKLVAGNNGDARAEAHKGGCDQRHLRSGKALGMGNKKDRASLYTFIESGSGRQRTIA